MNSIIAPVFFKRSRYCPMSSRIFGFRSLRKGNGPKVHVSRILLCTFLTLSTHAPHSFQCFAWKQPSGQDIRSGMSTECINMQYCLICGCTSLDAAVCLCTCFSCWMWKCVTHFLLGHGSLPICAHLFTRSRWNGTREKLSPWFAWITVPRVRMGATWDRTSSAYEVRLSTIQP